MTPPDQKTISPVVFDEVLEALITVLPYVETMDDGLYAEGVIPALRKKVVRALNAAGI